MQTLMNSFIFLNYSKLNDNRALENYNNAVDRLRTLLLSHTHKPTHTPRDSLGRSQRPSDAYTPHSSPYEVVIYQVILLEKIFSLSENSLDLSYFKVYINEQSN